MAAYLCCGLALVPVILAIRAGIVRWVLLLAPPVFLGAAGLLFPEGGLTGPRGALLASGVLLAAAAAAGVLRRRTPSPLLGLSVFLVVAPLALSLRERPTAPQIPADAPLRRNLVLVTLDTLRPDHLGLVGYPRATSPGLDSLAATGTLFTTAYAPAPSTSPSHASILTGVYPSAHGVRRNGWPLGAQAATLTEALASAGYRTGGVVSVAHLAGGFGWSRGFSWFHDRGRLDGLFPYSGARIIRMILRIMPMEFSCRAEVSVSRALAWLQRIDEPFFLWIHLWDPHDPYAPPPPYDTMFTGQIPVPEGSGYEASQVSTWVNGYDGEIRYADDQLGRLWRFLRDRGLDSRTVVVALSDHGESLGERSYQGHSILLYDEQVRVLFIMAGPNIEPARISVPVSLVDVMPTVLAALGLPPAWPVDGRPLLSPDLPAFPVRFDVDMWGFHGRGVRLGEWKLAAYDRVNPAHRGFAMRPGPLEFLSGTELYDVDVDTAEIANLATSAPDQVAALAELLGSGERGGASVPLTPAIERALRSLGYVE
jgi:arylsulfatase A-like enzyme